ncbi:MULTISPECIES: restriction endonuclease subunit S [Acinetobacter]|jgi:type I restriction enzyme S subunit|uniref:Restriction endonuclease subunit S n=3 Tax=Acinetobacter calcoaceticus/baumannii complex TaxID=909768 RepID=A0A6L8M444_ACIBA|nr:MULTISPECIES: restriction endonuclease subunit S [Acinetobacter]SSW78307.1 putative restriction endonuclease S subunit [Klebsiella pneumoniae]ATI37557.1 type I restriction endonuclease subunit R [Acinetobacter baumannii]EHU2649127.1 restriction endonuclease subunit S [Acinetobacter baumannii]EIB6889995.1 restriction endonuclease subunit S [Acinetobacter baumannii]ELW81566.1 type I restriction modification DNA specificity domain protein [Acinetobacter sp. OIFC021]
MSQLPRYESYKDSGVQWLGEIPSHWAIVRLDQGCEIVRGNTGFSKADLLEEGQYVALQYGKTYKVDEINNTFSSYVNEEFYKLSQIAMYGDTVLISTSETIEDLGHSCFYARQDIGLIGGEQFLLKVNQEEQLGKYLYYLSKAFSGYLRKYATGTKVYRFNTDHLKKIYIPQIPFNEQKVIADFLDKRLAQVDALIAKQETLLEKLAEQRVALISHAVTKGLNPDVEMKESGISWFKQIPKSWDVKQLKFVITKIQTGSTPPSAVPEYYSNDDIVWYGPADFTDENYILNESVKKISALALEDKVVKPMPKGSIMMIGIGATLGKVAITNVDCTTNQQINSLIPIEDVNAKYLMYQLNSLRDIVKLLSSASTLGIINQEKTKCLKIIVPSLNDQNEIVEFLDKELNEISAVKKSVEQTINKLKEYRSTLITQVVTGKIDVRNLKVN